MSVLIFVDQAEGVVKKASLEALSYGAKLAELMSTTAAAVVLGNTTVDLTLIGRFGVEKVYHADDEKLNVFDAGVYTQAIAQVAEKAGAKIVIFAHNVDGKAIAPRLSARLKAGLAAGAIALPEIGKNFTVRKNVFSGKAFATVALLTDIKIISLNPNSYKVLEQDGSASVEKLTLSLNAPKIKLLAVNKIKGGIPLTEAERVVSGGRGLKGPENWGIVEELAKALDAATACSRPVADSHWRPHHEHVGQTGFAIAPNLYIALGISGAIQHLAGVNRSKTIVVINKDAEAPFFKAADYGIVGDVFDVVPKITDAVKKLRGL